MGCWFSSEAEQLQLAIANSKLIRIKIISPAPGYEIEIHELENVLALLEKFALLVGLNKSAARFLQLEFAETILAHELQLEPAGLCDGSLCSVLGVEIAAAQWTTAAVDAALVRSRGHELHTSLQLEFNSKLIRIKIFSPAPGYEIEIHELENVLALLEKFALLVGLNRSAAQSLQLEFAETTLAHELQLES